MIFYYFQTKEGKKYETAFSPREIAGFQCFDAYRNGESEVVNSDDVDFESFFAVDGR